MKLQFNRIVFFSIVAILLFYLLLYRSVTSLDDPFSNEEIKKSQRMDKVNGRGDEEILNREIEVLKERSEEKERLLEKEREEVRRKSCDEEKEEVFLPAKESVKKRLQKGFINESTHFLHIVSHTHWDREWYLSFEKFRRALVHITDELWDIFKHDEKFYHWHFDGQMSVIEDYLEIRPYRLPYVQEAARKNFISLGPFYTQPDEFLISGESLIRNLLIGLKLARKFGTPCLVGYLPDTFGHIGQSPQILRGFGIDSAIIGRGIKHSGDGMPSEIYWRSPDGSRVLVIYLASWYCNALFHHRMSAKHSEEDIIKWFDTKHRKILNDHSNIKHALLLNGCDHTSPDIDVGIVAEKADPIMTQNRNVRVVHSSIPEFIEYAKENMKDREKEGMRFLEHIGELFTGQDVEIDLVNILSNQIHQKQANWRAQTYLEKYSEPINTITWLYLNGPYDMDMYWYSWKLLIQNHAHDSIGGCTTDDVHRDVDNRFARSTQVAESLFSESLIRIIQQVDVGANFTYPKVIVFNPLPKSRASELVMVQLDFYKLIDPGTIEVYSSSGKLVPSLLTYTSPDYEEWDFHVPNRGFRKGYRPFKRIKLLFQAIDVPAMGYDTYEITGLLPNPTYTILDLEYSEDKFISNEHWVVQINENGAVNMINKHNAAEYLEMNLLNFCSDAGTEYQSMTLFCEQPAPQSQSFEVTLKEVLKFPLYESATLVVKCKTRSITLTVNYVLPKSENQLLVRVAMNNLQDNWRLQAGFPILPSTEIIMDSQFDIVNMSFYRQPYHGHQKFIATYLASKQNGYIVANRGLPEIDLIWEKRLYLTLLRSVTTLGDWGVFGVDTAKVKGHHSFEYSIIPYFDGTLLSEDTLSFKQAVEIANEFNAPLVATQILEYETRGPLSAPLLDLSSSAIHQLFNPIYAYYKGGGTVETGFNMNPKLPRSNLFPARYSFMKLYPTDSLFLSALKKAEDRDSVILRCYNPTLTEVIGRVYFENKKILQAFYTNLNEERIADIDVKENTVDNYLTFLTASKKIITLELVF
jgi:alpha-mannosidase/mannosylglycerate hydrolase